MFDTILKPFVETAIRHGANAIGTVLVSNGIIDGSQMQTVVGAMVILGAGLWSFLKGQTKLAK